MDKRSIAAAPCACRHCSWGSPSCSEPAATRPRRSSRGAFLTITACVILSRSRRPTVPSSSSSVTPAAALLSHSAPTCSGWLVPGSRKGPAQSSPRCPSTRRTPGQPRPQEVRSLLLAGGVPSRGITLHHYHPDDPRTLPTIKLSYTRIAAVAGPCGLWPEDL